MKNIINGVLRKVLAITNYLVSVCFQNVFLQLKGGKLFLGFIESDEWKARIKIVIVSRNIHPILSLERGFVDMTKTSGLK